MASSGYATLARYFLRGLGERGVHPCVLDRSIDPSILADELADGRDLSTWSSMFRHETADLLVSCRGPIARDGHDAFARARRRRPDGGHQVGLTMLETDRVPSAFVRACNRVDRVWVPTSFVQTSFVASGVDAHRLEVVAPGVPVPADPAAVEPYPLPPAERIFLSVFAWGWRKGWDVLIEAYVRAFARDDQTLLVIRSSPPEPGGPTIDDRIDAFLADLAIDRCRAPRIAVIDHTVRANHMAALYAAADAFVLPSRGEGLGLPYLEAMAAGVPVIATAWSGQLDFLDEHNALLVDIDGFDPSRRHPRRRRSQLRPRSSLGVTLGRAHDATAAAGRPRPRGRRSDRSSGPQDRDRRLDPRPRRRPVSGRPAKGGGRVPASGGRHEFGARRRCRGPARSTGCPGRPPRPAACSPSCDAGPSIAARHVGRGRVAARIGATKPKASERCSTAGSPRSTCASCMGPGGRWAAIPTLAPRSGVSRNCRRRSLPTRHSVWRASTRCGCRPPAPKRSWCRQASTPNGSSSSRHPSPIASGADRTPSRRARRRLIVRSTGAGDAACGWDALVRAFCLEFAGDPVDLELRLTVGGRWPTCEATSRTSLSSLPSGSSAVERIRVIAEVFDEHDLVAWYRGASVFVDCSRRDGLGRAALEAAGLGVPVVCTDVACRSECSPHRSCTSCRSATVRAMSLCRQTRPDSGCGGTPTSTRSGRDFAPSSTTDCRR